MFKLLNARTRNKKAGKTEPEPRGTPGSGHAWEDHRDWEAGLSHSYPRPPVSAAAFSVATWSSQSCEFCSGK